jgi:hypothetical protein
MPPIEEIPQNSNANISTFETNSIEGLNSMRIMAIQHQQYHVMIKLNIQGKFFKLKALIDSRSDFNILNKDSIPSCYWLKNNNATIGLGNQTMEMEYEVEKVKLCFGPY